MNAKLLFTATLTLALASTLALAGEPGTLTRAEVVADYQNAAAAGMLRKNDYDFDKYDVVGAPERSRAEVVAEMATARAANTIIGPLRNRSYNPFGGETLRVSTVDRASVRADVLAAIHDGTLRRSDYDDLPIRAVRRTVSPVERPILARAPAAAIAD